MADETPNLVLEHLRAIREELREIREEQREQRGRLGSIERSISHMAGEIAQMGLRLDRMRPPRPDRAKARPRRGVRPPACPPPPAGEGTSGGEACAQGAGKWVRSSCPATS